MIVSLIVAHGKNREIGNNNQLLWSISEDLKNFKRLTLGKTLLMGRKTYESIGKPLPGRETIVMSRQKNWQRPCLAKVESLEEAIELCRERGDEELVVCGGGEIYKLALPKVQTIYLSEINWETQEADTYFPEIQEGLWKEVEVQHYPALEKTPSWTFKILERKSL